MCLNVDVFLSPTWNSDVKTQFGIIATLCRTECFWMEPQPQSKRALSSTDCIPASLPGGGNHEFRRRSPHHCITIQNISSSFPARPVRHLCQQKRLSSKQRRNLALSWWSLSRFHGRVFPQKIIWSWGTKCPTKSSSSQRNVKARPQPRLRAQILASRTERVPPRQRRRYHTLVIKRLLKKWQFTIRKLNLQFQGLKIEKLYLLVDDWIEWVHFSGCCGDTRDRTAAVAASNWGVWGKHWHRHRVRQREHRRHVWRRLADSQSRCHSCAHIGSYPSARTPIRTDQQPNSGRPGEGVSLPL